MKILYITCSSEDEAKSIARQVVELKLAACGNILSSESIYNWDDQLKCEPEAVLILKTTENKRELLITKVKELHSYDIPCILTLEANANKEYEDWVNKQVE